MTTQNLKKLLDICYEAKRIVETLPELPKGMKPRHIHVLEAIYEIQRGQEACRVSEVSARLNITTPSVTKLIQELELMGMLYKRADAGDRRVVLLYLTDAGLACVKRYVLDFHREWAQAMGEYSDEQVEETIHILLQLKNTMPGKEHSR